MNWESRIEINPQVLVGKPVIKGTRLAVEFIVELLANGWSQEQIVDNYPGITVEDIQACLHYAADTLKSERVYLTPATP
ncbi:MAG TPA: DUF433 domain-containing protein [Pirellulales bacterium]|nr:DUF433 domain-containing protein [Pirellulales bacterium]